jgi:hypothetical protein
MNHSATKHKSYAIQLRGLPSPKGTIKASVLLEIVSLFRDAASKSLRLSVEGSSELKGKSPKWLNESTDFLITEISKGSTILNLSAPCLSEVIEPLLKQQSIWNGLPNAEDTAMTMLSKSIADIHDENLESPYIDAGVIDAITRFKFFSEQQGAVITFGESTKKKRTTLDQKTFSKADKVKSKTPEPRAVILTGTLDTIAYKKSRFHLHLENDERVVGIFSKKHIDSEPIRSLSGKRITVKGTARFRASGKLATIEVDVIKPFEAGDELLTSSLDMHAIRENSYSYVQVEQAAVQPFANVWGQWMGDESVEELLNALKN